MGVLQSLLPIFLIIGLGTVLTHRGFLSPDALRQLNRLAYWVGMPALLFVSVAGVRAGGQRALLISAALVTGTLAALLVAWLAARLLHLRPASVGTLMQGAFRGNLAFVGLPTLSLALSRADLAPTASSLLPVAVLAMAPVMILYNVLAVVVLVASHQKKDGNGLRTLVRPVVTNPLVLAVGAGLLTALLEVELPGWLQATARQVGGLAVPAALLGVGGTLVTAPLREHFSAAAAASAIKIIVIPLVIWGCAHLLGMPREDMAIAVTLGATPTAAASFIMAAQLQGDHGLASSTIMLTTLGSLASLAVALTLF